MLNPFIIKMLFIFSNSPKPPSYLIIHFFNLIPLIFLWRTFSFSATSRVHDVSILPFLKNHTLSSSIASSSILHQWHQHLDHTLIEHKALTKASLSYSLSTIIINSAYQLSKHNSLHFPFPNFLLHYFNWFIQIRKPTSTTMVFLIMFIS